MIQWRRPHVALASLLVQPPRRRPHVTLQGARVGLGPGLEEIWLQVGVVRVHGLVVEVVERLGSRATGRWELLGRRDIVRNLLLLV